ncbi:hypothetical protein RvY_01831 [Ramazzottius varieornatus]|uniref:Uncharacterized protein n=1 Tax=Ramazzottius varieornatus TaxID=947166 RepID=A0A1D1UNP6_RAMVA|nr:hypothetical protein RvY_01831 [Ramazzottius varieornatus]
MIGGAWDGQPKAGELKYIHTALGRQLQRHLREQECLEYKQNKGHHFGHLVAPHCDHCSLIRESGGRHTTRKAALNSEFMFGRAAARKTIDDRMETFLRKHSAHMQQAVGGKQSRPMAALPGPSLRVGPLRKPRSAEQLMTTMKSEVEYQPIDVRDLQPGVQRLSSERHAMAEPVQEMDARME